MNNKILKEFGIGLIIGLLMVYGLLIAVGSIEAAIEEPVEEEPVILVEEEEEEEPILISYEEPVIENIEVEGNRMSAPYDFIGLDDDLQIYMEELCADMEINFFLAASIMKSESNFNPEAVGDGGLSIGLFQIRNVWWDYFSHMGVDVSTPKGNILGGLMIIQDMMKRHPDDVAGMIQCYKCGFVRGEELMEEGVYISCIEPIVNEAMDWQTRTEPQNP